MPPERDDIAEDEDVVEHRNGNIQEDPPVSTRTHQSWDARWITVEPVIFLFMFSFGIHTPTINGLTYRLSLQPPHSLYCKYLMNVENIIGM